MDRTVWIVIAVIALAAAGFFGYRAYQGGDQRMANLDRAHDLERQLEAARLGEKEAKMKADQEAEARRLAELKNKEKEENDARLLAQAKTEREQQAAARQRLENEAAKAAADLDRVRSERAQLEAEMQRANEERQRAASESETKLAAAQRALEESERRKNAEIERQAALIASYNRAPNQVEQPAATTSARSHERVARIIFPADYKRASHYNLPLLPSPEQN